MKQLFVVSLFLLAGFFYAAFAALVPSTQPVEWGPNAGAFIEPDGTLDLAFDPGEFNNGEVLTSALQSDGKLLIGGTFRKVRGEARFGLARLNADGTLDSSFITPDGLNLDTQQILVQPDGKIIVIQSNTLTIVRLNPDGSLDAGFDPSDVISFDGGDSNGHANGRGWVYGAALQSDGKLVVVGQFFYVITGPGM